MSTPPLPCVGGPLRSAVPVGADGVLDVDIPFVRVNGRITLRGAELPAAEGDRGALRFALRGGGVVETRRLGEAGAGAYAVSLLAGTYDVHWTGNGLCDGRRFAPVPCNAGPVRAGVAVHQDAALDVDVPLVRVQGAVGQDGGPLPDADGLRGSVSFTLAEGGSVATHDFGSGGAATYSLSLLPGEYTIEWSGNTLCGGDDPPPLPCNRGPLHTGTGLTTDGVLDLDVPVARVRGMVRLDGGLLPDAVADRGSATFTLVGGGPASTRAMGASGDSDFALSLLPGIYDVSWNGNPGLCDGRSFAPMPCNSGPVRAALSVPGDGVLDVDVASTRVQGRITLDGGSLPSAPGDRGAVTFTLVGGSTASIGELGLDGPRDYALTLVHGRYLVRHEANAGLCDGPQASTVPCVSAVVLGCTAP